MRWSDIVNQAVSRGACDCAICMVPISSTTLFPHSGGATHSNNKKHVILSCSHVFHEWCITSFENFAPVEVSLLLISCGSVFTCLFIRNLALYVVLIMRKDLFWTNISNKSVKIVKSNTNKHTKKINSNSHQDEVQSKTKAVMKEEETKKNMYSN
jgi:hypothetical protein